MTVARQRAVCSYRGGSVVNKVYPTKQLEQKAVQPLHVGHRGLTQYVRVHEGISGVLSLTAACL